MAAAEQGMIAYNSNTLYIFYQLCMVYAIIPCLAEYMLQFLALPFLNPCHVPSSFYPPLLKTHRYGVTHAIIVVRYHPLPLPACCMLFGTFIPTFFGKCF